MCEAPAGGEEGWTGAVERMTVDRLVKLLRAAVPEWLERDVGQMQEALGLADLQGNELMKFRWELAFLCMHATLIACNQITPEDKAEAVRAAYQVQFRRDLQDTGMPTSAIAQLINTWNRRCAEYNAASMIETGPGPIAHISNVAVKNIFGEPKEDIYAVFAVTSFYGPFLMMITEVIQNVEVRD